MKNPLWFIVSLLLVFSLMNTAGQRGRSAGIWGALMVVLTIVIIAAQFALAEFSMRSRGERFLYLEPFEAFPVCSPFDVIMMVGSLGSFAVLRWSLRKPHG